MKDKARGYRPDAFDRSKSLQQLEGEDWGEPTYPSHLVCECHRLRRIPLREFTVENLRIMIGQNIGLQYLVPLALERLQTDPYAEGDMYPGDLLVSVLRSDAEFWRRRRELRQQLAEISERTIGPSKTSPVNADETEVGYVAEAYAEFKRLTSVDTVTLYRPTGPEELRLVAKSGWKKWPPRLPGQPIFYPVTNEQYAREITQRWNVPDKGGGYVTRFAVKKSFMDRYKIHRVGGTNHTEWWIPAEDLEEFNANIVGLIEIIGVYDDESHHD